MVAPLVAGALIGGAGALGSAGLGAIATGNAARSNERINNANLQEQRRQNQIQRIMAERLLSIQLQGSEDAFGNRSEFIPGRGFVTTPTDSVKTLQNASVREQTQQLTTDATRQREGRERSAQRGREEGSTADSLLAEFRRIVSNPQSAQELFQLLLGSGQQAFQGEQDRQLQQVLRQNLRSGGSAESGGKHIAKFAAEGAGQRRDAAVDARLKSITGADEINNSRRGNTANLFNQFAQRAQNSFGNMPFAPDAISTQASTLGANQRSSALGGSQLAALLNQGTAPQRSFQPADLGTAKFVGEAGNVLSSLFRTFQSQQALPPPGSDPTARRRLSNQQVTF